MTGSIQTSESVQTSKPICKFKPGDILRHNDDTWFYSYKILEIDEYNYKILRSDNDTMNFHHAYVESCFVLLTDDDKVKLL